MKDSMLRKIEEFQSSTVGMRVRAEGYIFYGDSGVEVQPNTLGTVGALALGGWVLRVEWDGMQGRYWTSLSALEKEPG